MKRQHGIKSGYTLIELLVVVTILGLLAVAVLPAFTAGGDKRLLLGAAERLDTHLKHAAARATGKPRGFAVWLDAGDGTAVFDLNFARMPTGTPHSGKVSKHPNQEKFSHIAIVSQMARPDGTPVQNGSLVCFDMVPNEFRAVSPTNITFSDGDTKYNTTFPYTDANDPMASVDYVVYEPPSGPRITSRPTVMPARVCVDLNSSTIGVHNFGDYASSGTPDLLSLYDQFVICFDVYGKPNEAWGWSGSTATRIPLTPGKPIALLCTLAYQSGQSQASYPTTETNPGAGWQNPDAFWVVIDPKTGRNLIVENGFEPGNVGEAQEFIVKDLKADSTD